MGYSIRKIRGFPKRLEAVEEAIKELKEMDLAIAKMIGRLFGGISYNMGLLVQKNEQIKSYAELWSEKREASDEELAASQTVASALEIISKFEEEVAAYIRAAKVATAEEAMDITHTFIKKYCPVALPMKAVREDDVWLVDVDVGALSVRIAKVKVDARTGDILSYEIPPIIKTNKKHSLENATIPEAEIQGESSAEDAE